MGNTHRLARYASAVVAVCTLSLFTAGPADAGSSGNELTVSGPIALDEGIAFDGTNHLVVWTQYTGTASGKREVYAAFVNAAGTVTTPLGAISAANDAKDDDRPRVAWNGSVYLVVWDHQYANNDLDVQGQLVAKTGQLVGTLFNIASPGGSQYKVAVTTSGATFMAVWLDDRTGAGDIRGGRISDTGSLLDGTSGVQLTSDAKSENYPDVAGSSSGYYLTYELQYGASDPDIYGKSVTSTLGLGAATPLASGGDPEQYPAVASDGTNYLVSWGDNLTGSQSYDIFGKVIQNGSPSGPITISAAAGTETVPDIAFNGTYLVAWRDSRRGVFDIYGTRVNTAGTVQEPDGFAIRTNPGTGGGTGPALDRGAGSEKWGVAYDNAFAGGVLFRTASK